MEEALGSTIVYEVVSDGNLVLAANDEGVPFVTADPEALISAGMRAIDESLVAVRADRTPVPVHH